MSWYASYRVRDARLSAGASIAVSEYGVARGAGGGIVCDDQFDVEAEVCPGFVGVVGLAITLVEYGVR